jgi:hypothetical protein
MRILVRKRSGRLLMPVIVAAGALILAGCSGGGNSSKSVANHQAGTEHQGTEFDADRSVYHHNLRDRFHPCRRTGAGGISGSVGDIRLGRSRMGPRRRAVCHSPVHLNRTYERRWCHVGRYPRTDRRVGKPSVWIHHSQRGQ